MFRCICTGLKEGTKDFDFIYIRDIHVPYHLREGFIYPEIYWIGNYKFRKLDDIGKFKGIWQSQETINKIKLRSALESKDERYFINLKSYCKCGCGDTQVKCSRCSFISGDRHKYNHVCIEANKGVIK